MSVQAEFYLSGDDKEALGYTPVSQRRFRIGRTTAYSVRRDALQRRQCGVWMSDFMQLWPGVVESEVGVVQR